MSELIGWDYLRHGGLLLDPQRLRVIADQRPEPLPAYREPELRRHAAAILDGGGDVSAFVASVLDGVCGFSGDTGSWRRGSAVEPEWGRLAVTGETVKPRQLWRGVGGGLLPVFLDREKRVGIGRGRKVTSQVLQWLRGGREQLALVTNGRQWRLMFAGLDFDAWCEWDLELWFEEGALSPQVTALRTLLSAALWTPPDKDAPSPLLQAVLDSRKGQAELSQVLGERVREAVEILVQGHGEALKERCSGVDPAEIYRAAARVVMRMVVVLFAESRDLLPRDHALYYGAYGLSGLLEDLGKVAGRGSNRLARSWSAWPRVLALFRLVHDGSHHPELLVPAYGGELFAPGDADSGEGLSRALAVFESACFDHEVLADRDVHLMLDRITRTRVKLRQGRSSVWVPAPVDFSDLSSEYIGILYEGLLDFELKTAPAGDPVVFLAVGNQPALPLSRLEAMDDKALKNLFEKLKDTSSNGGEKEAEAEEEPEESEEAEVDKGSDDDAPEASGEDEAEADERHATRTRAETWARRAVEVGKLVRKPRGKLTPEKRLKHGEAVARKARQLVTKVILPGEWYLVRWGGTRKGSGTFYTRPGLAVPTVQRTLRPLAYDAPAGADGKPDRGAPAAAWTPKRPEDILALKVCDPACGSGSFPVAALRFLTDALFTSLYHHERIADDGERAVVALLTGEAGGEERLYQELLPCRPDDEHFEPRLKAVLRRHVVERCIYGVDLDPLAVELCRLALWIETMDRSLPFSFLDHKVKRGNSLLGAWFDQFQHYPVMAWKNREGGDKRHTNGVHFAKEARTRAIKAFVKAKLTPDLADAIMGQMKLYSPPSATPRQVHDEALALLERLHDLPVHDAAERSRIYREKLRGSAAYRALEEAMNLWCACWFWPTEALDCAPLPSKFSAPEEETRAVAARIAGRKLFFHWELEFPDVFRTEGSGFDAVLGNPPWDIAKPSSKEFFSNVDPLYRSYGKQEALRYQTAYFEEAPTELSWLDYSADFRAQSNFMKYAASAFGDPEENEKSQDRFSIGRGKLSTELHTRWRTLRARSRGFSDSAHPFRHQGSADINLYKLFLERAHALLRKSGRLGFIVPSGLYSDHGTGALRRLFLDACRWEWLFGFENRDAIFEIHRSYKFNPIIVQKGGRTSTIQTSFMRRKLEDWDQAEANATPYARERVEQFSPRSRSILEIQSARDLEVLEKIYANSVLLGDEGPDGWGVKYATEFHMTNDSKLFPPRQRWEEQGYRPDEYSRWLKGNWRPRTPDCPAPPAGKRVDVPEGFVLSRDGAAWIAEEKIEDTALPLYEGRMVGQFDLSQKGWVRGKGRTAVWREIDWEEKAIEPQYLMAEGTFRKAIVANYLKELKTARGVEFADSERERLRNEAQRTKWWLRQRDRLAFMDVTSATNARCMISSVVCGYPAGNSAPILKSKREIELLTSCLNSLAYDYVARLRCSGLHLNWFVIEESPLPTPIDCRVGAGALVMALNFAWKGSAVSWLRLNRKDMPWRRLWAVTPHERLRLRLILDALNAHRLGLDYDDFRFLLQECDWPSQVLRNRMSSGSLNPRGFWRVDKDKDPELRYTILALVAFKNLQQLIDASGGDYGTAVGTFVGQKNGEGWTLPETLRLRDYGLGNDDRAKHHQAVASSLGPRFYDWQLEQEPEESWRECHLHARNLLGEEGYRQLLEGIEAEKRGYEPPLVAREAAAPSASTTGQSTLFD